MPCAQLDGFELYYEIHGQGQPLVLIRGVGSTADNWYEQVPAFAPHYQVVIFDNRAIARSGDPGGEFSMADLAGDTVGLMDALGLERAHVLGLSLGGMIAQEVALSYPRRVDGLVLAATHCGGQNAVPAAPEIIEAFGRLLTTGDEEALAGAAKALFAPATLESRPRVLERYYETNAIYEVPAEVMMRQYGAVQGFDAWQRLASLTAPTLVLSGDQDALIPPVNSENLASQITGAKLVVIPGGGHQVLIEQPEAANQAILEFLAGV